MISDTVHPTFRQVVAAVAQRAQAILPTSTNGRIEAAIRLVLAHDVTFLDNGQVEVGSSSDPLKVHVLTGATCDCADFPRAPESWCKHRLAAGIAKRVHQEIAARSTPVESETETEVILPDAMEVWGDNDNEGDPEPQPAPAPTPAPLPEAPFSLVRRIGDGEECYQCNQECWDFLYTPTLSRPAMA